MSGRRLALLALVCCASVPVATEPIAPSSFAALRWRLIGPFRAGRVSAGAVDPVDPNTYYFGTPGGGVWKSSNAAQTWTPIFDAAGVASVGALAIAPSNPRVLYAGTGEETRGNGIYKSTDAGVTWANVGLRDTHFIGSIVVSENPDEVLVAAIGDRTPGPDRGVFQTKDGGRTWTKTLFLDDESGCPSIAAAPDAPRIVYATLYPGAASRGAAPARPIRGSDAGFEQGERPSFSPPAAIFRSNDGGTTWARLSAKGLAGPAIGRQALAIVADSAGRIVLAGLRDGLYKSEDGGESWTRATDDPRIRPIGVITDPINPALVYVTQTSLYQSTDGGRTFAAFAGAPSGDDFQLLWIDRNNSKRLLAGVDQGAVISVDAGASWSSWYNQPTGQFYHVVTDDRFPYHVFAAQQDSGSVAVPNRSDYGEISYRDWYSPGGFEFGYLAPDPLDPDIVFGGGWYRTVVRFDRKTGQIVHVFVPGTKYRSVNNAPMAFSPHDPHALYYGTQFLMRTTDAGATWQEISPDLTAASNRPAAAGPPQLRSITTFSVSAVNQGVIWAATNNGVIQTTKDGGATWRDVSPADLPGAGGFETVDAGRHDAATAYAAYIVPNDLHPYIYRTRDAGTSWQRIVQGLPDTSFVRVVREDPLRSGLVYCGTESGVFFSVDAGDHWQSLQLNLPASSMRDLAVHGDDLVLATYGRSLWILDNVAPLRQLAPEAAASDIRLLEPAAAIRARFDVNGDTPLPVETPTAPNPPEGAVIDYFLKRPPGSDLTLTVFDDRGRVVRSFSSTAPPASLSPGALANVPGYWFGPPPVLTTNAGLNRFAWDLRYPAPKILPFGYFGALLRYVEYTLADHAIPGRTPREQPEGPLVVPGQYTIDLSTENRHERQTLVVSADPRIKASPADLVAQFDLANRLGQGLSASFDGYQSLAALRRSIAERVKSLGDAPSSRDRAAALKGFDQRVDAIQTGTNAAPGLGPVNREMARLYSMVESGDARPSEPLSASANEWCGALTRALDAWRRLNADDLPAVNRDLSSAKVQALAAASVPDTPRCTP